MPPGGFAGVVALRPGGAGAVAGGAEPVVAAGGGPPEPATSFVFRLVANSTMMISISTVRVRFCTRG